ncbi:hypothetical protein Pan44_36390 [Caulifigura coniformis]|uniref:Glycosyltransferase RgtA/B/C/D-like domain-containing protein n=1 Tax=Caulifigura coniformis TaxID=2527983 RepID=A0A517SHJ1_9PLAN|nr:hypothetical protein [Caulifigura coniformis]QDT55593.1 hypothetical protein Pan44_36390 [Caulifigura coniformis]
MPSDTTKQPPRPEHSSGRVRLLILIAMVLGTVRLFESPPLQSANDRSRWATAWSLVERQTFRINEIRTHRGWDTIDKVKIGDDYYSSKPPLYATIVAGGYWATKTFLGWKIDPDNLETVTPVSRLILFLFNIVPTTLALGCFAQIVWRHGEISFTRNFLLAAACFGTLWSAYMPSLNNHTPAICCVVFALRAAIASVPGSLTTQRMLIAGFMSGLAVTFELPALAFLAGLFVILLKLTPKRAILAFLPMAIIPLAAFLATNKMAMGQWEPAYASYDKENSPYKYDENGVPSYWKEPKGLDKNADTFYVYLFHCTLGHHGILSLTPIFFLSLIGLFRIGKWRLSPLAAFHLLGAMLTVIVLGFYLSRTENWNYGGVSVGLRWMLWLIPFWLLMMMPAVDLFSGNRFGQGLLMLLMAPSVFSAWHPFDAPWKQPWIFTTLYPHGFFRQYDEPRITYEFPRRSWLSQLPAGDVADPDYWVELSGAGVDGSAITLRVADGGPIAVGNRAGRKIAFISNEGRPTQSVRTLIVDVESLTEGRSEGLLLWPEGEPAERQVLSDLELLCGVPVGAANGSPVLPAYRPGRRRYQRIGVRNDAFLCDTWFGVGARQTSSPGLPVVHTSSECWSTPELPFGVAYWNVETRDAQSQGVLAVRRLVVVRSGKFLELATEKTQEN